MSELEFHEKLPFSSPKVHTGGTKAKWDAEAKSFMEHPNKWAKLVTYTGPMARQRASNTSSQISRKDLASFRTTGRWLTARHPVNPETVEVWVMHVPGDEPAPPPSPRTPKAEPKRTPVRGSRTKPKR